MSDPVKTLLEADLSATATEVAAAALEAGRPKVVPVPPSFIADVGDSRSSVYQPYPCV